MKNERIQTHKTAAGIEALREYGMHHLNTAHRGLPFADREDVLQDALIDLTRNGGRIDNPAAFLRVIIDRTAATAAEKLKLRRENEVPGGSAQDLADREHAAAGDKHGYALSQPVQGETPFFAADFDRAVRDLPDTLRDVFIVVDIRGLSQDEAAIALGVPQQTLSRRLDLARDLVKEAVA